MNDSDEITNKVEIYLTPTCPYCIRAKRLLVSKGVSFTEYNVSGNAELREQMVKRSGGGRTVPQIFIDDIAIGGCDDLQAKDRAGELPF